ncbi:hypothetical protein J2P12_02480 [Candidatus Bathyarchaeota archaeon]|nr:hypothetical protein [Candidatus Bathyarchaeota archaeon]
MATLAEALKDRKNYSDDTKFRSENGFETTLGELRAFQEATGRDVAKELEAERAKMAEEQKKLAAGQEEIVRMWTELQAAQERLKGQTTQQSTQATDWTKDPFFAPVAEYLRDKVESQVAKQAEQIANFQKALGLGVKYITDVISEQRYAMLPEDFRKETPYEAAVRTAAEKKFLDSGGIPDVRKVYDEWQSPRQKKAELERIQKEAYEKARADVMSSQLARPSGMPVSAQPQHDPNAPKNIRESFQRLKEDPEFLNQIYNLTGQA